MTAKELWLVLYKYQFESCVVWHFPNTIYNFEKFIVKHIMHSIV